MNGLALVVDISVDSDALVVREHVLENNSVVALQGLTSGLENNVLAALSFLSGESGRGRNILTLLVAESLTSGLVHQSTGQGVFLTGLQVLVAHAVSDRHGAGGVDFLVAVLGVGGGGSDGRGLFGGIDRVLFGHVLNARGVSLNAAIALKRGDEHVSTGSAFLQLEAVGANRRVETVLGGDGGRGNNFGLVLVGFLNFGALGEEQEVLLQGRAVLIELSVASELTVVGGQSINPHVVHHVGAALSGADRRSSVDLGLVAEAVRLVGGSVTVGPVLVDVLRVVTLIVLGDLPNPSDKAGLEFFGGGNGGGLSAFTVERQGCGADGLSVSGNLVRSGGSVLASVVGGAFVLDGDVLAVDLEPLAVTVVLLSGGGQGVGNALAVGVLGFTDVRGAFGLEIKDGLPLRAGLLNLFRVASNSVTVTVSQGFLHAPADNVLRESTANTGGVVNLVADFTVAGGLPVERFGSSGADTVPRVRTGLLKDCGAAQFDTNRDVRNGFAALIEALNVLDNALAVIITSVRAFTVTTGRNRASLSSVLDCTVVHVHALSLHLIHVVVHGLLNVASGLILLKVRVNKKRNSGLIHGLLVLRVLTEHESHLLSVQVQIFRAEHTRLGQSGLRNHVRRRGVREPHLNTVNGVFLICVRGGLIATHP